MVQDISFMSSSHLISSDIEEPGEINNAQKIIKMQVRVLV